MPFRAAHSPATFTALHMQRDLQPKVFHRLALLLAFEALCSALQPIAPARRSCRLHRRLQGASTRCTTREAWCGWYGQLVPRIVRSSDRTMERQTHLESTFASPAHSASCQQRRAEQYHVPKAGERQGASARARAAHARQTGRRSREHLQAPQSQRSATAVGMVRDPQLRNLS